MSTKGRLKGRKPRGQQLIEVLVGLIGLIPVFLFLIDIWFIFIVNALVDTTARDASRAAAAVFPAPLKVGSASLSGENKARAEAVVELAKASLSNTQSDYIKQINLVSGTVNVTSIPANIDLVGGSPEGTATVRTQIICNLPVSLAGFGQNMPFVAEATFPLTCTKQGNLNTFVK